MGADGDSIDGILVHIREAVKMSREHVAKGGIPFSGIVLQDGRVLGTGFNRVREDGDRTAHAEIVALRNAAKCAGAQGTTGSTLIASGEPCAMCYLAALYCRVSHIVFAADRATAATYGFDYTRSYSVFATDPVRWSIRVTHVPVDGHEGPFQEFLNRTTGGSR